MMEGAVVQGYKFQRRIGQGGMGEVWEGSQLETGRRVAIKLLHSQFRRDQSVLKRFRFEVEVGKKLGAHPNIVETLGLIESDEVVGLVMTYVQGTTLEERLAESDKAMEWHDAWPIVKQVLSALQHAHSLGLAHRDVKPANVLLDENGHALLCDFGLAKAQNHNFSYSNSRMGTSLYMAPEQFSGEQDVGPRADVWGVGMMVWRMLAGRLPVDSANQLDVAKIYMGAIAIPRLPHLPAAVDGALSRALSIDPAARPKSAGDLLALFPGADKPVRPEPPTKFPLPSMDSAAALTGNRHVSEPTGGKQSRGSLRYWLMAGAFLLVIGGLAFGVASHDNKTAVTPVALGDDDSGGPQVKRAGETPDIVTATSDPESDPEKRSERAEAERIAKEEADRKVKEEAVRKAKEEAEESARLARAEADRRAKDEAARKARIAKADAERKAKVEAETRAKEDAERKAREEAERKAREEAERKAREKAAEEAARQERLEAQRRREEERREEQERCREQCETKNERCMGRVPSMTSCLRGKPEACMDDCMGNYGFDYTRCKEQLCRPTSKNVSMWEALCELARSDASGECEDQLTSCQDSCGN